MTCPHAAARVGHVADVTRYYVHVQVTDGLAGSRASVEAHIEAVRLPSGVKLALDVVDEGQHVSPLVVSSLPPRPDKAARHNEGVSRADWVAVGNGERRAVGCQPLRSRDRQERRLALRHVGSRVATSIGTIVISDLS
jgi:hypothetical protein